MERLLSQHMACAQAAQAVDEALLDDTPIAILVSHIKPGESQHGFVARVDSERLAAVSMADSAQGGAAPY